MMNFRRTNYKTVFLIKACIKEFTYSIYLNNLDQDSIELLNDILEFE